MKLSCHDQPDWVQSSMKTRLDNNITDRIGLVYAKIEINLLRPIWLGVVYDEN